LPQKGLRKGWKHLKAKQTAGVDAVKNRWLGPVAARVALARPAGAFEGGQMAGLTPLKTDGWGL